MGGVQQEVAGFGKGIERKEVGSGLQVGGSRTKIAEPCEEVATLFAIREIGFEIIKRLGRTSGTTIDDLSSRGTKGADHLGRLDDVSCKGEFRKEDGKHALERSTAQLRLHFTCDEVAAEEGGVQGFVERLEGGAER